MSAFRGVVQALAFLAGIALADAGHAATLSVSPASVPAGDAVTATWSGIAAPTGTDWIGLATPGSPYTSYLSYRYTTGAASGNVPFTIPANVPAGTYELRLFANNGYTLLATSNALTVVTPSLTASPASVTAGETVTAAWSAIGAPTANDWIGLFTPAAADGSYVSWRYTSGTASGSVPFTIPGATAPGTYQLRLFANNGYTLLATSNNFAVHVSVSGTVTASGGAPLAGVALSAPGGSCTASNASGQYTCAVPSGWSGSVTPALASYTFTPASRSYSSVTVNQSAQNYTASTDQQVSGTVAVGGSPLGGVAFTASNGGACTASNAAGQYTCTVPLGWSGIVTPSLADHIFTPASRSYTNVTAAQTSQDYAATVLYDVSGSVTLNGLALANVIFTATNGVSCTSDSSGQYSCTAPQGWSGAVTPSATGYSFSPASRSYSSLGGDQTAQSFTATLDTATAPLYFVHADHLNTPRLVANAAGATVWRWDQQEPFGVNVPDENPSSLGAFEFPLRFPGQYADKETNLFYNHFRDYDADLGIYKESDLIGLQGGLNTYIYVSAAPLRSIDPTGLLEDFTLTLNRQPLTTLACDCGDNFSVFSGIGAARNDPGQIANSDIGPIPVGKYYIVARQPGGLLGSLRDWGRRAQGNDPTSWFSLIAMDGDNDDCTVVNGVVRCAFRMHPGRVSQGCITFPSSTDFHRLRDRLLNTTIDLIPGTKIPYYGTVTVQ